MKFLLGFMVCVGFYVSVIMAYTEEEKVKIREIAQNCIKSSGVTIQNIMKARKKDFVDDPKMEDYVYCVFTTVGVQEQSGAFLPAVMKEKSPKSLDAKIIDDLINKCKDEKGSTPQKTAYAVYKCMRSGTDIDLDSEILS